MWQVCLDTEKNPARTVERIGGHVGLEERCPLLLGVPSVGTELSEDFPLVSFFLKTR